MGVLTWILIASLLGCVGAFVKWWFKRVDNIGRPQKYPPITCGVLLLVALTTGWFVFHSIALEDRLSGVASKLVGRSVTVKCESISGTFVDAYSEPGYVMFNANGKPERKTTIKPDICSKLQTYLDSSKKNPSTADAIAVHIITHESMHMRGIQNEALAECAAVQRDTKTAELLGAPHGGAVALAWRYWNETYPQMPDSYRTTDCGAGTSLDENLPDPPWR